MSNFWFFHKLEFWLYTKTRTRTSQKLTNHHKKLNFSLEKSNLIKKCDFTSKNIKNSESPKMTSKVLYELLLTSYEQFLIFSQTWNLTLHKNTNKDQPKTNQPSQKVEFQPRKEQLISLSTIRYPKAFLYIHLKYLALIFQWLKQPEVSLYSFSRVLRI